LIESRKPNVKIVPELLPNELQFSAHQGQFHPHFQRQSRAAFAQIILDAFNGNHNWQKGANGAKDVV